MKKGFLLRCCLGNCNDCKLQQQEHRIIIMASAKEGRPRDVPSMGSNTCKWLPRYMQLPYTTTGRQGSTNGRAETKGAKDDLTLSPPMGSGQAGQFARQKCRSLLLLEGPPDLTSGCALHRGNLCCNLRAKYCDVSKFSISRKLCMRAYLMPHAPSCIQYQQYVKLLRDYIGSRDKH